MTKFKTKSTVLLLAGYIWAATAAAQSYEIAQQVIGAADNSTSLRGMNIEATVGELAVLTLSSADNARTITQGFHQPEGIQMAVDVPNSITTLHDWQLQVFPNPTKEGLFIRRLDATAPMELQVEVLDARGQIVRSVSSIMELQNEYLSCSELLAGYYLLRLRARNESKTAIIPFIKIK